MSAWIGAKLSVESSYVSNSTDDRQLYYQPMNPGTAVLCGDTTVPGLAGRINEYPFGTVR